MIRITAKVYNAKEEVVLETQTQGVIFKRVLDQLADLIIEELDWLPVEGPDSWDRVEMEAHREAS